MASEEAASLNDALNKAAGDLDVDQCRALLNEGASAKHVFHSGGNDWYNGDSSTCLFNAIKAFDGLEAELQQAAQERYADVVVLLLSAGADASFSAQRGNWNRVSHTPLMDVATLTLVQLGDAALKKRLLLAFASAGVELNAKTTSGKQGSFGGYGEQKYALFEVVRGLQTGSDLSLLEVYLDASVNVNCSESSWSVDFDDEDDEEGGAAPKDHQTLLHAAIQTGNVELVRLLVTHGAADVSQNMVFTSGGRYYLMSALQLAKEMGHADIAEVLAAAGAQEEVSADLFDTVGNFYKFGGWDKNSMNYREGGEGKWVARQPKDDDESEGKRGGGKKKGKARAASPAKAKGAKGKGKKKK